MQQGLEEVEGLLREKNDIIQDLVTRLNSQEQMIGVLDNSLTSFTKQYIKTSIQELQELGYVLIQGTSDKPCKLLCFDVSSMGSHQDIICHKNSMVLMPEQIKQHLLAGIQAPKAKYSDEFCETLMQDLHGLKSTVKSLEKQIRYLSRQKQELEKSLQVRSTAQPVPQHQPPPVHQPRHQLVLQPQPRHQLVLQPQPAPLQKEHDLLRDRQADLQKKAARPTTRDDAPAPQWVGEGNKKSVYNVRSPNSGSTSPREQQVKTMSRGLKNTGSLKQETPRGDYTHKADSLKQEEQNTIHHKGKQTTRYHYKGGKPPMQKERQQAIKNNGQSAMYQYKEGHPVLQKEEQSGMQKEGQQAIKNDGKSGMYQYKEGHPVLQKEEQSGMQKEGQQAIKNDGKSGMYQYKEGQPGIKKEESNKTGSSDWEFLMAASQDQNQEEGGEKLGRSGMGRRQLENNVKKEVKGFIDQNPLKGGSGDFRLPQEALGKVKQGNEHKPLAQKPTGRKKKGNSQIIYVRK